MATVDETLAGLTDFSDAVMARVRQLADATRPISETIAAIGRSLEVHNAAFQSVFDRVQSLGDLSAKLSVLPDTAWAIEGIKLPELPSHVLQEGIGVLTPRLDLCDGAEETIRRVVRQEIERAMTERSADSDGSKYGSDGLKRPIGFERESA